MLKKTQGFTLIELMVVCAIIAILAAVAIPNYAEHVQKGKRADAKTMLLDIASRQERFYTQYSSYTAVLSKPTGCSGAACGLGLSGNASSNNFYTASVTTTPANCSPTGTLCTGYTLTATLNGRVDANCGNFTLTNTAIKGKSGTKDAAYCWR